jgi:hypothetical protein
MLEVILICAISVGLVCWFECRAVNQADKIEALELWAKGASEALHEQAEALRQLQNVGHLHNGTLATLAISVDDLQKFAASFRLLRDSAEIIQ